MTEVTEVAEATEAQTPEQHFAAALRKVCRAVDASQEGSLSRGDIASLRRDDGARSPVFYKLAGLYLQEVLPTVRVEDELAEAERRWATVAHLLAQTAGQHVPRGPRFGAALADANLAEARFVRLLRAEGEAVDAAARAVIAPLVQRASSFDPFDLAELILTVPHPDFPRLGARADKVRRRIARDFYRAAGAQSKDAASK